MACIPNFTNIPADGALSTFYQLGNGPMQIDFPDITNSLCDFNIELFESSVGTAVTSAPLTFVDTVLTENAGGDFELTDAAYITMDISDHAYDQVVLNLFARVNSNVDAADALEQVFSFAITLIAPPCGSWLVPPTLDAQYEWYYGDPPLTITFTDAAYGSCEYEIGFTDAAETTKDPLKNGLQETQPSLWEVGNTGFFSMQSQGYFTISTTDESLEGYHALKAHTIDPQTKESAFTEVTILIRGCIPEWKGIPGDFKPFEFSHQIGLVTTTYELTNIENKYCSFSAIFYNLNPQSTDPTFSSVQPTFSTVGGSGDWKTINTYLAFTVQTDDFSLFQTIYNFRVDLTGSDGSTAIVYIDLELDFGNCNENLKRSSDWLTSFTYNIGQPTWYLPLSSISNGDCPYTYSITRQGSPSSLIQDEFPTWMSVPEPIWYFPASASIYLNTQTGSWSFYTQDTSLAQVLYLTLHYTDLKKPETKTFDFTLELSSNSCTCSFQNIPATSYVNYELDSGVTQQFSMGTIDNNQCPYTVAIWDTTEGTSLPADFSLTQTVQNLPAFNGDPCGIQTITYPSVTMAPISDFSLEFTTLDLLMTIYDTTLPTSTDQQSQLLSQITFVPLACVPTMTLPPILSSYEYKIGDPELLITFAGAQNGNCQFSTIVSLASSFPLQAIEATDPSMYSYTDGTQAHSWPTTASTDFSITSDAVFGIQTSDLLKEGIYVYEFQMTDTLTLTTNSIIFSVQVFENLCTSGFQSVPSDSIYTYVINQGDKDITMSGLTNTQCDFITSVWADSSHTTSFDSTMFNFIAPVISTLSGQSDTNFKQVDSDGIIRLVNTADTSLDGTSYTLYVLVESNRHILDTVSTQFTVTFNIVLFSCSPQLTTSATMDGLWPNHVLYKIGTSSLMTIQFAGADNGDCEFSSSLMTTGSTSPPISPEFTFTEQTFSLVTFPDQFSIATQAKVDILITDPNLAATYSLTYSLTDPYSATTYDFDFTVEAYNSLCSKGFQNVPLDGALSQDYTLNSGPMVIAFTGLTNTECQYSCQVFWNSLMTDLATVTQYDAVFAAGVTPVDPDILTVTSDPSIEIDKTNFALEGTTRTFYVKLTSQKDVLDTDTASFTLTISYVTVPCSPALTLGSAWPTSLGYRIGDPQMTVTFAGSSNNDCTFSSQVFDATTLQDVNDAATGNAALTYTPESLTSVTPPYVFSISTVGQLDIYTTDTVMEAYYDLQYVSRDFVVGVSQVHNFQLRMYNNQCIGGFQGLPSLSTELDKTYSIDTVSSILEQYELTGMTNSECTYSVDIHDTSEGTPLPAFISLTQPTFQPVSGIAGDEVQQTISAPQISVQTSDESYIDTEIEVLVILRSTRYSGDPVLAQFTMKIGMIRGCTPSFPVSDSAVQSYAYDISLEAPSKSLVVPSFNQKFVSTCTNPYQTSMVLTMADGSPLDSTWLVTSENWTATGLSTILELTTVAREKLGSHSLLLVETSSYDSQETFSVPIVLLLSDHCDSAQLELLQVSEELEILAGDSPLTIPYEQILALFAVDTDHQEFCTFLELAVSTFGTSGLFDEAWVVQDDQNEVLTIQVGDQVEPASFQIIVSGQLKKGEHVYRAIDYTMNVYVTPNIVLSDEQPDVEQPVAEKTESSENNDDEAYTKNFVEEIAAQQGEFIFEWTEKLLQAQNKEAFPPEIAIDSVNQTGQLVVGFSKEFTIPSWELILPGTFDSLEERLATLDLTQFLKLHVESDQYQIEDPEIAISKFSLLAFTAHDMTLQVEFESPNTITQDAASPDQIYITVINNQLFIDKVDSLQVLKDSVAFIDLVPQITTEQELSLQALQETLDSAMGAVSWANLFVNLALSYGLKYLWNAINLLQMAVFVPIWKLNYSPNALAFLEYAKMIALMEFLPSHLITDPISSLFGLDDPCEEGGDEDECNESLAETIESQTKRRRYLEQEDSDATDDLSLEEDEEEGEVFTGRKQKPNLIKSMGIILAIAVLCLLFLLLMLCLRCCIYRSYACFSCYMNLRQKIFYNAFFRFAIQSSLKMQISACVTLTLVEWGQSDQMTQGIVAILTLVAFQAFPFLFIHVMYKYRERLDQRSIRKKIGTLYSGLDTDSTLSLAYTIIFLVRRSLFCFFTFAMINIPGIQVQVFIFSSVVYVIYLNHVTFETKFQRVQENFNEAMFIFICYHLVLYSNLVDDYDSKIMIGESLMWSCIFMLTMNIFMIMGVNCGVLKQKCRKRSLKKKQAKAIRKAKTARLAQKKAAKSQSLEAQFQRRAQGVIDGSLKYEQGILNLEKYSDASQNSERSDPPVQNQLLSISSFSQSNESADEAEMRSFTTPYGSIHHLKETNPPSTIQTQSMSPPMLIPQKVIMYKNKSTNLQQQRRLNGLSPIHPVDDQTKAPMAMTGAKFASYKRENNQLMDRMMKDVQIYNTSSTIDNDRHRSSHPNSSINYPPQNQNIPLNKLNKYWNSPEANCMTLTPSMPPVTDMQYRNSIDRYVERANASLTPSRQPQTHFTQQTDQQRSTRVTKGLSKKVPIKTALAALNDRFNRDLNTQ